ncbi:MAG: hypothetical protein AB8B93_17710 [Pseudomonadales bacterium]
MAEQKNSRHGTRGADSSESIVEECQHSTLARNELAPLLEQLILQLGKEGRSTHRAYFDRIRRSLNRAQDEVMLAVPIIALSSGNAVGIELSADAEPLHQRIVEKAVAMVTLLDTAPNIYH